MCNKPTYPVRKERRECFGKALTKLPQHTNRAFLLSPNRDREWSYIHVCIHSASIKRTDCTRSIAAPAIYNVPGSSPICLLFLYLIVSPLNTCSHPPLFFRNFFITSFCPSTPPNPSSAWPLQWPLRSPAVKILYF